MDDIEQLCARLTKLGVDRDTIATARKDLTAHAHQEASWIVLAAHLRRIAQFDASLETYKIAARRFPNSARLWGNRGILLREQGYLDKAIESFKKALKLKPDYVHAIESIAIAYEKLQDFSTASKFYKQAMSLDENRPTCWFGLGNCLMLQGLHKKAEDCYQEALKRDPKHLDTIYNLALLQYELKKYAEALQTLRRYAELNPSDPSMLALKKQIEAHAAPVPIGPAPLHDSHLVIRAGTNIDKHGNVIKPDLTSNLNSKWVLTSDEILTMSREDAARVVGTKAWDIFYLGRLVKEGIRDNAPPPQGFFVPFISYRWGDSAHSKWVFKFVDDLEQRGYDVVFDRKAEKEEVPPTVPEMIARMTKCNLFIAMLTDQYTRRVLVSPDSLTPLDDGWLFDEWNIAIHLGNMKRLQFVGIWASGEDLPPPFTRKNVYDFRDPNRYIEEMDKIFPARYFSVIGIRPNNTFRALTHLKRPESKQAAAKLKALNEFEQIAIVEESSDRSKK